MMKRFWGAARLSRGLVLVGSCWFTVLTPATAGESPIAQPSPLEPARAVTVAEMDRALARITSHRRVLMIGAHPDDEHNALLAFVARELSGEIAYLSLSRGEGGQNLIGPQLGVGLGLIRTGELLAARRLEGARQYFTRSFDFGYTRSLSETLDRWPEDDLMTDVLRVVERFKPQVVVSIFPDDGRGGHGQHQAAGRVAHRLFEQEVLQSLEHPPQTLFRGSWWMPEEATFVVEVDGVDAFSGYSTSQLAAHSRSQHRSQDMGRLQDLGPVTLRLTRMARPAGASETAADSANLFSGVDDSLGALAAFLPDTLDREAVRAELQRIASLAEAARQWLSPAQLNSAAAGTGQLLADLLALRDSVVLDSSTEAFHDLLAEKIGLAELAYLGASKVFFEASTAEARLVEGSSTEVGVAVWNAGAQHVQLEGLKLMAPSGWEVSGGESGEPDSADGHSHSATHRAPAAEDLGRALGSAQGHAHHLTFEERSFDVSIPMGAAAAPYFLELPRRGDLYDWSAAAEADKGEAFERPPLMVEYRLSINGVPVGFEREVVSRRADQALGEVREPLVVVPAIELAVDEPLVLLPLDPDGRSEAKTVVLRLRSNLSHAVRGRVAVAQGPAWRPQPVEVELAPQSITRVEVEFEGAAIEPGLYDYSFLFETQDGATASRWFDALAYPHIRTRPMVSSAELAMSAFPFEAPKVGPIGYVRGASDRVPEALRQVGLEVELLTPESLRSGDLERFRAIVVGSRAYEVDSDLVAANQRLLNYVEAGGLLLVQYQQYAFVRGGFAPFRLEIDRPHARVTDEESPVRFLDEDHPVFHTPNPIGLEDFDHWVSERGLYFPSRWDEAYTPLLALQDPEQPEQEGALLIAEVGQGTYIYTGLSFFRELPAGVAGAYRLFANLLAQAPSRRNAR